MADWDDMRKELRRRNAQSLPILLKLEAKAREGYGFSSDDHDALIDGLQSASSSIALGETNRAEAALARRLLALGESIETYHLQNEQRRYNARFPSPAAEGGRGNDAPRPKGG